MVCNYLSIICGVCVAFLVIGALHASSGMSAAARTMLKELASTHDASNYDQTDQLSTRSKMLLQEQEKNWVPDREWFEQCIDDVKSSDELMTPFAGSVSKFQRYRLGDCIKMCTACTKRHGNQTIVARYVDRACPRDNPQFRLIGNLPIVLEIFRELEGEKGFSKPDPDALVIHLRLGDVIEGSKTNVTSMLTEGGNPRHARHYRGAIRSYFEYMNNIQESGCKKVVLVGGSHKAEMYEKSRQYLHCLERAMVKSGVDVEMRINTTNPDHDFYYISNAKQLTVSTGGFSRIMGNLAEAQGGKIIGRKFEDRDPVEVFRGVENRQ